MRTAVLSWLVFVPVFAGLALLGFELVFRGLWGRALPASLWWGTGFVASAGNAGLAVSLWSRFEPSDVRFQFIEYATWLPHFDLNYLIGVDGVSLLAVAENAPE